MKRLIGLGLCMALFGCLDGPDDGAAPATTSPSSADWETAEVAPRVGFGEMGPAAPTPAIGLVAGSSIRPVPETEGEVIKVRAQFSPENLRRADIFRMKLSGVHR
jgi:hypothetical protein